MDNPDIDETAIRAYLLGRIGPEEKLSTQIDERMLKDREFSLLMDVIEDEILEYYVEGALSATDTKAVEIHFLTPPERQRKLRAIRLINRRFGQLAASEDRAPAETPSRANSTGRRRVVIFPSARTWAEIAAGLALVSCSIYLWNQQRELRADLIQSRQELASSKEARRGTITTVEEAVVTLNLMVPGLSRGDLALPEKHLSPSITTLHVEVALTFDRSTNYQVQLKHGGTVVWSQSGVHSTAVPGGSVLTLNIPANAVPSGTCELAITSAGNRLASYWFIIAKIP